MSKIHFNNSCWFYVKMGRKKNVIRMFFNKNQNKSATCKYCNKIYRVINVCRMSDHIKKCLKCPKELKKKANLEGFPENENLSVCHSQPTQNDVVPSTSIMQTQFVKPATKSKKIDQLIDSVSSDENVSNIT